MYHVMNKMRISYSGIVYLCPIPAQNSALLHSGVISIGITPDAALHIMESDLWPSTLRKVFSSNPHLKILDVIMWILSIIPMNGIHSQEVAIKSKLGDMIYGNPPLPSFILKYVSENVLQSKGIQSWQL